MTDFLVMIDGTAEHYFFRAYEGICVRRKNLQGVWQERICVYPEGRKVFAVYADKSACVNVICVNSKNEIVYLLRSGGEWRKHILVALNREITVLDIRLFCVRDRLNLLYSAQYGGENLLIHCILGDHAKPNIVAILENSHFYIFQDRVYFTNSKGEMGYLSLLDEKPQGFKKLYDDAHFPILCNVKGNEILVYTKESKLFVNGEEILYDSRMEKPILVRDKEKLYVMWKSGGLIRYSVSFNDGATWSGPMRFLKIGTNTSLFVNQAGNSFNCFYGEFEDGRLSVFGCDDIFCNEG